MIFFPLRFVIDETDEFLCAEHKMYGSTAPARVAGCLPFEYNPSQAPLKYSLRSFFLSFSLGADETKFIEGDRE